MRPRQAQRAERRGPEQRDSRGVAQIAELDLAGIDLAGVEERRQPQRAVLLGPGHREQEFRGADPLGVAAGRVAELIQRTERERTIAAPRAGAAAEVVLEERQ